MRNSGLSAIERVHHDELLNLKHSKTLYPYGDYPGLRAGVNLDIMANDVPMALRWSALLLTEEAIQTYIAGWFQASILCAGAALERVLKAAYISVHGSLPKRNGHWTLGSLVNSKSIDWNDTQVTADIVESVVSIVSSRNSRAHALLESESPGESYFGGSFGRIQVGEYTGLIQPYRHDAKAVMAVLFETMDKLHGQEKGQRYT